MSTAYFIVLVIGCILVLLTLCASVAYVFCGKKRRKRRTFPIDAMPPVPPSFLNEEGEELELEEEYTYPAYDRE